MTSALSSRSDADVSNSRTVARSDVELARSATHVVATIGTKIPLFRSCD